MTDTSPAARAKQDEILRAMTGEQRMELAYEMSMFARDLAREGIRRDHPEWTEAQIARTVAAGVLSGAVASLAGTSVKDKLLRITVGIGRKASDSETIQLPDSAPQGLDAMARWVDFPVSPLR